MNKKYPTGVGIFLIIVIICIAFWKTIQNNYAGGSSRSSGDARQPLPKEVTITLDKNGFSPNVATIKIGSAVRWKNVSGSQQTVNSDNYPTNQLHKELNFGVFNNGSSVVYTFTKPGIYSYHNQFHHEQEGKVIVQ